MVVKDVDPADQIAALTDTTTVSTRDAAASASLIVPVRNEAETLPTFLASILVQKVQPFEIVLVDAGSTDSSAAIMHEYQAKTPSMIVLDGGAAYPGRARNIAIQHAHGAWVAMTDAGTIVDAAWFSELVTAADREQGAHVVCGTYQPLIRTFFEKCVTLAFIAPAHRIGGDWWRGPSTASLLLRKDVWQELGGFPEDLRACEDLLFFRRLTASGHRVAYAPRAIVRWRVPATIPQLFGRFRAYSFHTLKAGLGSEWHASVGRMYLAAAVALMLALFVHWIWFLLFPSGLLFRAVRSVKERPDVVEAAGPATFGTYPMICLVLLCIDLAALLGAVDHVRSRGHAARRVTER